MKKSKTPKTRKQEHVAKQIEHSMGAEVRRLKAEVDDAYKRYKREPDPMMARPLMQNWLKLSSQLASLAKAAPKADLDASQVLVKSDVEAAWTRSVGEFRNTMEQIPRRVAVHSIFKGLDPVDVELTIRREIDVAIHQLYKNSGGTEPLPPAQS
jgi:hypothetical protein